MQLSDFITGGRLNSTNLKTFVRPFFAAVVVLILFVTLLNVGISKIRLQLSELNSARQSEEALSTKLSKLKDGTQMALENTNKLVVALPQKNPVMVMISQIKRIAIEKNITVGKFEISGLRSENNLNSIELQAQLEAPDINSLMEYMKELPKMAPVSSVFGVKIVSSPENKFEGDLELTVYWSDFPSTIPAVREPVTSLSQSELNALEVISNLREPEYQILEPSTQGDRLEPFN
jgi:hypothetical protein